MDNFPHSIEDLENITGVKRRYIDRCYEKINWLERYRKRSPEANKYYYNNNAVAIFHRVKDLKDQGLNRSEIKKRLEEMGLGSEEVPVEEGREDEESSRGSMENIISANPQPHEISQQEKSTTTEILLIQALEAAHERTITSLEELLTRTQRETTDLRDDNKTLRNENRELRETILRALPAGKPKEATPESTNHESQTTTKEKPIETSKKGKWSIFNQ